MSSQSNSAFTFVRSPLSKYYPDIYNGTYIEGQRLRITGSGIYTVNYNINFTGILRKVSLLSTGSFDGDYFSLSGSDKITLVSNSYVPTNGLGLVVPFDIGEEFSNGSTLYLTYIPTGSNSNTVFIWYHFLR